MQSIWINDPGREGKFGGATAGNVGEKRREGRPREKLFGVSYFSNPVGKFSLTYHSELVDGDSASGSKGIALKVGINPSAQPSLHDVIRPAL